MASSSSLSVQLKNQVFLSSSEDTLNNFTSHLHAALERKGIDTCIDNELERGEEISQAILTAIEESKISIIVFSKNYASSSWCLDKLSKILECKGRNRQIMVVPIFYHVDVSDLRNQTGSLAVAFAKYEECFKDNTDKVERWRDALVEVSYLSGWLLQKDKLEAEVIQNIVKDIWAKLNHKLSSDVEGLVGMESRIEELEKLLDHMESDSVRILGIWGMPGVGKTITAEVFFKHISFQFNASYFIANVREKSIRQELPSIRNELVSGILKEDPKIGIEGTILKETHWLSRGKVLIVLDDVSDSQQVEDLIGERSCFGSGSTIIITSRDKEVLMGIADEIYVVEKLAFDQALELFIQFAFRGKHSKEKYMRLLIRVVRCADGIPLVLKILGSFLYNESERTWEIAFRRLERGPKKEIHNAFRISYDELDKDEKEIFLDVACFFKGEHMYHVADILDGYYMSASLAISVLVDKSLITILNNNLQMHDMIQEMGWEIVHQESEHPGKRSRLWIYKDIIDVLTTNKGTEAVEGIFLNMSNIETPICINPEAFLRMCNLRLLKIYNPHSREDYKVHLPVGFQIHSNKLAYLHWHCYPSESLPLNFNPENLIELHMQYSHIIQLWKGAPKLSHLKWIDLSYSKCLEEIPDLSEATNLERISLVGCTSLLEIPSTALSIPKLQAVYLSGCSNLKKFPLLSWNVKELHLDGTVIEEVPSEIQNFSRLIKLSMKNCKMLKYLPTIHGKLRSLEFLDLSGCSSLVDFPDISWNLKELLLNETAIEVLPLSIEFLGNLVSLKLQNCTRIKYLFSSNSKLKSLECLDFSGCSNLEKFPLLSWNVKELHLDGTAIEEVPSEIQNFSRLIKLSMKNCKMLQNLPTIHGKLRSLEFLDLSGCSRLVNFPEISRNLRELLLNDTAIEELPASIGYLGNLISLKLQNCTRIKYLPGSISKLKSLECLDLSGCSNLRNFAEIPGNVKRLYLEGTAIEEDALSNQVSQQTIGSGKLQEA